MENSVREIMRGFARRTGLEPPVSPSRRYLWTDAFAVCNFLGLFVENNDDVALGLALQLVDETHIVLGRHRPDATRRGWLSGLDDEYGAEHPTLGGLRIGKNLPERRPDEPFDAALEWERDGQYFHYLTKWAHALDSVSRVTKDPNPRRWAIELARSSHDCFAVRDASGTPIGFHWKMRVDRSGPLVDSMGQHDPLDAFITYSRLQAGNDTTEEVDLSRELHEAVQICVGQNWYTEDALGIGGLLTDAYALARMMVAGIANEPILLDAILASAIAGLETFVESRLLERSNAFRLPFREFGLSIGLSAATRLQTLVQVEADIFKNMDTLPSSLSALARYSKIPPRINAFWLAPENRGSTNWTGHREINEVMLATSLAPYGYLEI